MRADTSFRSEVANDAINTPELIQDPLWLLRARATWAPRNADWELSLFGTNLTNEKYITSGVADSPGFGLAEVTVARPRELGVTLTYKFGSAP